MPTYYTKKELVAGLKRVLATNQDKANEALRRIYSNQTPEERSKRKTIEDNNRGFNGRDAQYCSYLARGLEAGCLDEQELRLIRKVMPKYAGQLVEQSIRRGLIKKQARGKYYW